MYICLINPAPMKKLLLILSTLASLHCSSNLLKEASPSFIGEVLLPPKIFYQPNTPRINFENPRQGQKSYYIRFKGNYAQNDTFFYTKDTLCVEIALVQDSVILLEENYTSRSLQKDYDPTQARTKIVLRGDSIAVKFTRWQSVFLYYNNIGYKDNALYLQPTTSYKTNILGKWLPSLHKSGGIASPIRAIIEGKLTLFGRNYEDLYYHSDRRLSFTDGPTLTFIYNKKNGMVRVFDVGYWFGAYFEPEGWDLLP
jgi:hypothetical protein